MKQVGKIIINKDSDFGKSLLKEAEVVAEEAAALAAERARKEVLARATQRAAAQKAFQDSLKYYDQLAFKNQNLIDSILASRARRSELDAQSHEEWKRQEHYHKQLQEQCFHEMAIEHRTTWSDEYDTYHDGDYERKCVECLLVEESSYHPSERNYGLGSRSKVYSKLLNSQIVRLRKMVDGKEFELEWDNLKW